MGYHPCIKGLGRWSMAMLLAAGSAGAQTAAETPVSLDVPNRSIGPPLSLGDDPNRRLIINGFGALGANFNNNTGESSFSSFTFDFARPVKFTGVQIHDAFSPSLEGFAIVSNGADLDTDNNKSKTAALYGLWSPSLAAHIGLGVIRGAENDGTSSNPRTTVVATLLFQPAEHFVWGGETVAGNEPQAGIDGGSARWYSQMLFAHARFGPHWAGTVRVDGIDDRDGARTGTPQTLKSFTVSPQYLVGGSFYGIFRYLERTTLRLPELSIRLDLRYDRSSVPVFTSNADGVGRRDHASATLQTVFLF
jgi:hypothetical protein